MDTYIVYDKNTKKVVKTFKFFCSSLKKLLHDKDLGWINITFPGHADILKVLQLSNQSELKIGGSASIR